jgi:hypothetical protein
VEKSVTFAQLTSVYLAQQLLMPGGIAAAGLARGITSDP